ncbi:MAG: electron transfer flavoprotein subunit alpha [Flavobacteriales bacterium]|nr:electron transfer flavoprotein subunit alpha [Flavobacteriales bacterium]
MSVLAIINTQNGFATKSGLESASYAAGLAAQIGTDAVSIVAGPLSGTEAIGAAGIARILHHEAAVQDSGQWAKLASAAADSAGATHIVCGHDHFGRAVAPRVAVRLNAGLVAGVTQLPEGGTVRKNVFSGKAMADVVVTTEKAVYTVTPNAFGIATDESKATVEAFSADIGAARETVAAFEPASGDGQVPLPEAELVVSAGRGLKGPENWGIVEELATALRATTACSRPVSDIGWRPHHEHVGQTGITIRPNLYIAAGISGAIQHLAGVNQSKTIVVINTDPEAPFFKAADYGIVGDAFEVLPKLTAAVHALDS